MTLPASAPSLDALQAELKQIKAQARTALRVTTTKARIAQTSKQVIWTLNNSRNQKAPALRPRPPGEGG